MNKTINEVQIIPIKAQDGLVAFASLVFDDLFIGSIGIHTRLDGNGYRLTYPTKQVGNKQLNIYHPINTQTSKTIENAIIAKYKEVMKKQCMTQSQ